MYFRCVRLEFLTLSGERSRVCSINADNSTSLNLCVAMALPSYGGIDDELSKSTPAAVTGGLWPIP